MGWNAQAVDAPAQQRIYEVRAEGKDGQVCGFGARRSRSEGEALLEECARRYRGAKGWRRWWLEEIDTTGLWQSPPAPKPRDAIGRASRR
jgi:hypothetical protein